MTADQLYYSGVVTEKSLEKGFLIDRLKGNAWKDMSTAIQLGLDLDSSADSDPYRDPYLREAMAREIDRLIQLPPGSTERDEDTEELLANYRRMVTITDSLDVLDREAVLLEELEADLREDICRKLAQRVGHRVDDATLEGMPTATDSLEATVDASANLAEEV